MIALNRPSPSQYLLVFTEPTGSMPPRLTQRSVTMLSAEQGADVHLSCAAQGNPPPTFTWVQMLWPCDCHCCRAPPLHFLHRYICWVFSLLLATNMSVLTATQFVQSWRWRQNIPWKCQWLYTAAQYQILEDYSLKCYMFSVHIIYFMHFVLKFMLEEIFGTRMGNNYPRCLTEFVPSCLVYCWRNVWARIAQSV